MMKMKNLEKRFDAFEALVEANSGKEDFPVELGYIDEAADGSEPSEQL